MKFKRSERLVDLTATLLSNPNHKFVMTEFQEKYQAAKSSLSEDVAILNNTFTNQGLGRVETYAGAGGGLIYHPDIPKEQRQEFLEEILQGLSQGDRILPGGYIYLTDVLGKPNLLKKMGKIIASQVSNQKIDYVLTVATKGIPVAQAAAYELGCPFVIAHKDSKVTEGTTISVKYTSESSPDIVQRMEVVSTSIKAQSRVILVDDFYRGGGTMAGLSSLVHNLQSEIIGKFVFCENHTETGKMESDVKSIVAIKAIDNEAGEYQVVPGSLFN